MTRNLMPRFGRTSQNASEKISDLKAGTTRFVKYLKSLAENVGNQTSDAVTSATEAGKERVDEFLSGRTGLVLADSVERLKSSENPLIRLETQKIPQNFRASFLYAAAAAGMFANATEVTRVTRALMDDDKALLQQWLRNGFNPEQAADISAWMDRVPGTEVAGGFGHRLLHGHDAQAMFELMREHGSVGAIEWTNHVWLRDFWTPHGVPYLPAGTETGRGPEGCISGTDPSPRTAASPAHPLGLDSLHGLGRITLGHY